MPSNLSPFVDGLGSALKIGVLGLLASVCFVPWKLGFATRNMALCMFGVVFVLWLIAVILL